jgi:hypothetical protein
MVELTSTENLLPTTPMSKHSTGENGLLSGIGEKLSQSKEKIFDFFRYQQLKLKEHFGKIDKPEFLELLDYDFKGELKDNIPNKSMSQLRAWSACRMYLERVIEFDPEVQKDSLTGWVDRFNGVYRFSEDQKKSAYEAIDSFYQKRGKAKEAMEKFPEKHELVNHLTGLNFPKGTEFDISLGPMSINITTGKKAFSDIHERKHGNINVPYLGFATMTEYGEKGIHFTVINSDLVKRRSSKHNTLKHEEEHVKNRLFRRMFDNEIDSERLDNLRKSYENEADPVKKEKIYKGWLSSKMMNALGRAKDEFIATIRGGVSGKKAVKLILERTEGNPYDYLAPTRKEIEEKKYDKKTAKKMLEKEYDNIVISGRKAFTKLKHKGKMSTDLVIAMLSNKSMDLWPETVKRYLEEQRESKRIRNTVAA